MTTQRTAVRVHRPDARLILGLLLVIGSVVGVVVLVVGADHTEPAYVSAEAIPMGARIDASSLTEVRVRVDDADARYLTPGSTTENMTASRFLPAGELIPLSALGDSRLSGLATIVIKPAVPLASAVGPGAHVSVWATPKKAGAAPRVLTANVEVREVDTGQSFLDAGGPGRIELLVPDPDIPLLLASIAAEDSLAVVGSPSER